MFYLIIFSTCWKFSSDDELELKCSICKKIIKYHLENPNSQIISIIPNSYCENEKNNKFCDYISASAEQIMNITSIRGKKRYCINSASCIDDKSHNLAGARCNNCISLVSQLLRHMQVDRKKAFNQFCRTSRPLSASLCGDIIDDGLTEFLEDVNALKDPISVCTATHFCRLQRDEM